MIIFVRHAHTFQKKGVCIGQTDIPLSPKGHAQAQRLAQHIADGAIYQILQQWGCTPNIDMLWSSPLLRTRQTAEPISKELNLPLHNAPAFAEITMGAWENLSFATIQQQFPQAYAERGKNFATFRPPKGESFADVAQRAIQACMDLPAHKNHIIFTHAGVIRSVLCVAQKQSLNTIFQFTPAHTSYSCFAIKKGVLVAQVTPTAPPL